MRILLIHNFHRTGSSSGDDVVFRNEVELLKKNGNEVLEYTITNSQFDNSRLLKKILYVLEMFWSVKNYRRVKKNIKLNKPDVVHIHTFFPLLSPSIFFAPRNGSCKVVVTLHDTRLVCPCATSLRGGKICNDCIDGKYIRMVRYGCYKNSKMQSLVAAGIFYLYRWFDVFNKYVDKFICLNDNQISLITELGIDPKKIVKKYNYIEDPRNIEFLPITKNLPKRFVSYYGRIGEEKGIKILMKVWDKLGDIPLVVMGSGPLEEEFLKWSNKKDNIYYLGYTPRKECMNIVKKSEFVVFPSICYEGCSMVVLESEGLGKGLVASDIGFASEAIIDGVNGYKVPLYNIDAFVQKVKNLWDDITLCKIIGNNARTDFEQKYLPNDNYHQLMYIYKEISLER